MCWIDLPGKSATGYQTTEIPSWYYQSPSQPPGHGFQSWKTVPGIKAVEYHENGTIKRIEYSESSAFTSRSTGP